MNLDTFTRHLGAGTIAVLAVLFSAAVCWQIIHGHDVDPLLASLCGGTIAYLLPSPLPSTSRVTVENDPDDPVPTADVPAKRRKDAGHGDVGGILYLAIVALVIVLILAIVGVI